jgi:methyl halide transferase
VPRGVKIDDILLYLIYIQKSSEGVRIGMSENWEERWREQDTPWDLGQVTPALRLFLQTELGKKIFQDGQVLVPGCGTGYDLFEIATLAKQVLGLDLAASAFQHFESLRNKVALLSGEAGNVDYRTQDFFTFPVHERFDAAWDYTFYCALSPDLRAEWAKRYSEILKPQAYLVTLLFPVKEPVNEKCEAREGPPFPVSLNETRTLLESNFDEIFLEPVQQSPPGRDGLEWIAVWKKRRL